jgi:hypothetical protein
VVRGYLVNDDDKFLVAQSKVTWLAGPRGRSPAPLAVSLDNLQRHCADQVVSRARQGWLFRRAPLCR